MQSLNTNEIPTKRVVYPSKNSTSNSSKKEFPVLIGIPVPSIDHKMNVGLSKFLSGAAARRVGVQWTVDSRLAKCGRNIIIDDFLHNKDFKRYDYLMFMDHDCHPIDDFAIEKMIEMDKDVVAGITPVMFEMYGENNIYFNVQREDGRNLYINELPHEPFKARRVGGTCILMKRHVLEAIEPPFQMDTFDEKHISFLTSEDYYFCDKITANGFNIWINPEIWNRHYHNMDIVEVVMLVNKIVGLNTSPSDPTVVKNKEAVLEMAGETK
jgi:GT2 family glycosyltransferase